MPAPPTDVRAVVFDFNGTLSDDEPIMYSIYRDLFGERGRPITEEEYFGRLAGHTEGAIIGGWLGVEGDELAALVEERVSRYQEIAASGATISEAVREAVRYAAARVPVAVVSGAFRREIAPVLAAAGIAPLFAHMVAADDVANGKPHPEGYDLVVRLLDAGGSRSAIVAFEDTEVGVASAKDAGLRCLAVRGTLPADRLARADEIVDRLDVEVMHRLLG
jgi:beta-phosphoglucomutase